MDQRGMAAKQFVKNQAKKVTEYFKPTEKVRARDVIRELPGAVAQTFSGTRDTIVKGGKILGEGLAYATSPNVRKMYQAGNTDILPTVSNTTPRQMLGNTAKSAFEIAPVGKIKGLATAAMSAKMTPRVLAGGAMGYGYDVADKMSRPKDISKSTFHPGIATLAGALMGGMSRPTSEMLGQAGREIGDDIRNINPANRLSRKVVDKYDYEPVPGVFAPGGIQQQRPIMESFRKEVETTQMPFEPQSSIAKLLLGKQAPVGMSIKAVDDPLLQEARKYKSAEEFVKGAKDSIKKVPLTGNSRKYLSELFQVGDSNIYIGYKKTGKVSDVMRDVFDGSGKSTGKMRSETPEIDFRVFQREDGFSAENAFIKAQRSGNGGITTLDELPKALKSQLTDLWKKANQSAPDPLTQEARKYKSAEEFVKAQGDTFYHGGTPIKEVGNMRSRWKAFYMSENPTYAKSHGGNGSSLNEMVLSKGAKMADLRKPSEELIAQLDQATKGRTTGKTFNIQKPDGSTVGVSEVIDRPDFGAYTQKQVIEGIRQGKAHFAEEPAIKEALKKLGYDGMITQESKFGANYGVWNKNVVKTKSQLTDLWKKAIKK